MTLLREEALDVLDTVEHGIDLAVAHDAFAHQIRFESAQVILVHRIFGDLPEAGT